MRIMLWFIIPLLINFKPITSDELVGVLNQLKPYHVTTLLENSIGKNHVQDRLLHKIASNFPNFAINLDTIGKSNDNRSLNTPVLQNPSQSTMLVIIFQKSTFKKVYNTLNMMAMNSSISPRPKCLLIFLNESDWSDKEGKKILNYAWSLQFSDFSALVMKDDNRTFYMSYNPFKNKYDAGFLGTANDLFPDKIHNVNKYPLIIPGFDMKPYFYLETIDEKTKKIRGTLSMHINMIAEKLNFKPRFTNESTKIQRSSNAEKFEELFKRLEENKLQMSPITFLIDTRLYGRNLVKGFMVREGKAVVLVPVLEKSELNFTIEIFLYILSLPVIVGIFYLFSMILKFERSNWTAERILRLLIGWTITPPEKRIEKSMFLFIAVLSIIFTTIFLTKFSEMKIVYGEQSFDSVEDILNSKMKIYSYLSVHKYDSEDIQKLFSKSEQVKDIDKCVEKLIETRRAVCITLYEAARFLVESHKDENRNPIMKMSKIVFRKQFTAYAYEKASPFAKKFDKFIKSAFEAGIPLDKGFKSNVTIHKSEKIPTIQDILFEQLISISITGFSFSIMILTLEFAKYNNVFSKLLKIRKN